MMKFTVDRSLSRVAPKGPLFVDVGDGIGVQKNLVPVVTPQNGCNPMSPSLPDTKQPLFKERIIPRDFIPSQKLQKVHGHLADKMDDIDQADKALFDMQQMKTTIKRRGYFHCKVKIIQKARELMVKCKKNGLVQLITNFKDIELSWAEDHSDENAKKLWQALFGQFNTKVEDPSHSEVAVRHVMSKLCLKHDQAGAEDWKASQREPGKKGPSSCVEKLMSECKGQIVRLECRPGKLIHGHSLVCVASEKAKLDHNLPKWWTREKHTFYPFFKTFTPSAITQDDKKAKLLARIQVSSYESEWTDDEDDAQPLQDDPFHDAIETHTLLTSLESFCFQQAFQFH